LTAVPGRRRTRRAVKAVKAVRSIVVIGGGGHAKVLIAVLKQSGRRILGYTDQRDRGDILAVPYLGTDTELGNVLRRHRGCSAVIGIGKIDASHHRLALQSEVEALGFELPPIVSHHAVINEDVRLGPGTVVLDGVVVNSGTEVGSACILNTGSTLDHDCRLGDDVHIAPGVTVSGGVTIGDHCLIGAGATMIQGVRVCADCLVGAGATVVRDLTTPGTYAGTPARRLH
jgi:sugar O-acyltransferase (sialic acid O-acetyltransferase NeuD family)